MSLRFIRFKTLGRDPDTTTSLGGVILVQDGCTSSVSEISSLGVNSYTQDLQDSVAFLQNRFDPVTMCSLCLEIER